MVFNLNSVIFHTERLKDLRPFYEDVLGFEIGTYLKEGRSLPDFSETYVNYKAGSSLLCFEFEKDRKDLGTLVLHIQNLSKMKAKLLSKGVTVLKDGKNWFKISDPEGREIIFEELNLKDS